jgi:SAM-dependent methyltransferase
LSTPAFSLTEIQQYYDRNTPAFVRLGQGGSFGAIHRAVWGPGITERRDAFRYVEERLLDQIRLLPVSASPLHIVDLGCGIGTSLCYLAKRVAIRGTGVTLSPVQAQIAAEWIAAAGFGDRVRCIEGDYCALPADLDAADLAYAIESFVHGPSPERFFAEAARLVRPGGVLVICDDVSRESNDPNAARLIERFQQGWHVNSLLSTRELQSIAAAAGFTYESTLDLSPYLELGRFRDRMISVLAASVGRLPIRSTRLAPLLGGSALQTCLARGWIAYDFTVFRRTID